MCMIINRELSKKEKKLEKNFNKFKKTYDKSPKKLL